MRLLTTRERLTMMNALIAKYRDIEWKAQRTGNRKLTLAHKDRIDYMKRLKNLIRDDKMGII